MAQFLATPLAMTQSFFHETLGYGPVGTIRDYEERKTVTVDGSVGEVLEHTWELFQNVGPGHMTPDDGRSLMVGDIIRLVDVETNEAEMHKVDGCGFSKVESFANPFPRATAAARGDYDDMGYAALAAECDDMMYAEIASEQADVDASE